MEEAVRRELQEEVSLEVKRRDAITPPSLGLFRLR